MDETEDKPKVTRGKRGFPKGKSGNPSGRPVGSRNKNTIPNQADLDDMMYQNAEIAIKNVRSMLKNIDKKLNINQMMKLCMWVADYAKKSDLENMKLEADNLKKEIKDLEKNKERLSEDHDNVRSLFSTKAQS